MKTVRLFASALIIIVICCAWCLAAAPSETWMSMYVGGQKVGYTHITFDKAQLDGKEYNRAQTYVKTRLMVLGTAVQQEVRTVVYSDERSIPRFETFDMTSGGRRSSVEAKFGDKEIKCNVIAAGVSSDTTIPIPDGASLVGDPMYALGTDKLKVGQKARMYYFNPIKLSVDPIDVEVRSQEKLEMNGKSYETFVVSNSTSMGDLTVWMTESGSVIKVLGVMGLTMQLETREAALAGVETGYTPPADLAVLTSVKADKDIRNPRDVKSLTIRLSGKMDPKLAISDSRQNVTWIDQPDGSRTAEFIIKAEKFDSSKSVNLPIKDSEFTPYLKPTVYLNCDSPKIKAKSAEIVGKTKSAYSAAIAIRDWVHKNMSPQTDIGIARPATDVLAAKYGVCRDYAVLYAALARAAGIPTKVVAGLVYLNGSFYYHAWAESYVGKWVPFDATLADEFVDATHIKLTEGDAGDMFEMARVFGHLKAEIIYFD